MILLPLFALLLFHNNLVLRLCSVQHSRPLSIIPRIVIPVQYIGWQSAFHVSDPRGPRWTVLVRVDGLTYSFLGDVLPNLHHGIVNLTYTVMIPTQTMVTAQAGPMQVNLIFLNPIEVRSHSSVTFNVYIRIPRHLLYLHARGLCTRPSWLVKQGNGGVTRGGAY
jgi:hypothetical protein